MRHGKLTADEIFTAEKAVDDRRQTRRGGFSMAKQRDLGRVRLSNGVGMYWRTAYDNIPLSELPDFTVRNSVPEGMFALEVAGEVILFDAEEFRRWLRWA